MGQGRLAMMRQCGDCQLCCRLLPVPPLEKKAGQRCQYQKFGKGCTVYHTRKMPRECGIWNCRWLVNNDTADLSRPDRSHYVIDIMPDFVTVVDNESGAQQNIQVVQIWCDPNHREAHRDPALRAYLSRRAEEGIIGMVRFDTQDALTIIPPKMASDNQWHEHTSGVREKQHTIIDILQALGEKHEKQAAQK
jgi:hypothetical protein